MRFRHFNVFVVAPLMWLSRELVNLTTRCVAECVLLQVSTLWDSPSVFIIGTRVRWREDIASSCVTPEPASGCTS